MTGLRTAAAAAALLALAVSACGAPEAGLDTGPARRNSPVPGAASTGAASAGTAVQPSGTAGATPSGGAPAGSAAGPALSPAAGATVPPGPVEPGPDGLPWATVTTGRLGSDPAVRTFARYAPARTQAFAQNAPDLPALARTVTPQRLASDAGWLRLMVRNGHTVPRTARWAVVGVSRAGTTATVTACVWGPSAAFVDPATRRLAEPVEARWYAYDFRLVRSGDSWLVAGDAESSDPCKEAR